MLFTRGASPPWDPTLVSDVSRLAVRFLTASAPWEARYPTQMRALFSTRPGAISPASVRGFPGAPSPRAPGFARWGTSRAGESVLMGKLSKPEMFLLKVSWDAKIGFQPGPHGWVQVTYQLEQLLARRENWKGQGNPAVFSKSCEGEVIKTQAVLVTLPNQLVTPGVGCSLSL